MGDHGNRLVRRIAIPLSLALLAGAVAWYSLHADNSAGPASTIDGEYQALLPTGELIFAADRTGQLTAFDLSKPRSPNRLGSVPLKAAAVNLSASGTFVYVSLRKKGLAIIDASDPSNMKIVNDPRQFGEVSFVLLGNDFAYLAGPTGLGCYKVTERGRLKPVASYPCEGFDSDGAIRGNVAYLLSGYFGLQVVDLTLPFSPAFADMRPANGAQRLVFNGDSLFIPLQSRKLLCFSLADPVRPALKAIYDRSVNQLQFRSGLAYAGARDRIVAYDITDITAPVEVASYRCSLSSGFAFTGKCMVAADKKEGLQIFEVP